MIVLGIDPGTKTGVAQWSVAGMVLGAVESMPIHRAMALILAMPQRQHPGELLVIFEDARQRKGGFEKMDRDQAAFGAGVREGVGAAKRDAAIWDEFLRDHGVPSIAQYPRSTKMKAGRFQALTGWAGRTNEHGRDAAMLVYGIDDRRAAALLEFAKRGMA